MTEIQPLQQNVSNIQPMQRCSVCKTMRITPTDFIRRNKQWKTCNYCSVRVCKKNQCADNECGDNDTSDSGKMTVTGYLDKFFACFDTSNLSEGDLEDYNRLKYMFESIQMNQNSLVKDIVEFVNDVDVCQNTDQNTDQAQNTNGIMY